MNWQQVNWPLALFIYLGLLGMFGVIVYCTYFPIRFMRRQEDRKFYFHWLIALWSLVFLVSFVLPTLALFGIVPWSITDPAITTPLLMALVFMVFFPRIFQRMRGSPKT